MISFSICFHHLHTSVRLCDSRRALCFPMEPPLLHVIPIEGFSLIWHLVKITRVQVTQVFGFYRLWIVLKISWVFLISKHMFSFFSSTLNLFPGRDWLHFLFQDSYERAWCPGAFRSSMAGWEQHHWVSTPSHPFRPLLTVNTTWTPPSTPASCQWCSLA